MSGIKYTSETIDYIRQHLGKQKNSAIADHIGVTPYALAKWLNAHRKEYGLDHVKKNAAIGDVRVRKGGKRGSYEVIKTAEGWKFKGFLKKEAAQQQPPARKQKPKPKPKPRNTIPRKKPPQKIVAEKDKVRTTRVIDLHTKTRVCIPELNNMILFIDPSKDIEAVKRRYTEHRRSARMGRQ